MVRLGYYLLKTIDNAAIGRGCADLRSMRCDGGVSRKVEALQAG